MTPWSDSEVDYAKHLVRRHQTNFSDWRHPSIIRSGSVRRRDGRRQTLFRLSPRRTRYLASSSRIDFSVMWRRHRGARNCSWRHHCVTSSRRDVTAEETSKGRPWRRRRWPTRTVCWRARTATVSWQPTSVTYRGIISSTVCHVMRVSSRTGAKSVIRSSELTSRYEFVTQRDCFGFKRSSAMLPVAIHCKARSYLAFSPSFFHSFIISFFH